MIFVNRLAFIHTAEYLLRDVELRKSHQSLAEDQDVGDEAHDAVGVCESSFGVACFIHLDYCQTSYQSHDSDKVQCKVDMRSRHFLLLSVGRLQDEDGLRYEEDTGRIDELRRVSKLLWIQAGRLQGFEFGRRSDLLGSKMDKKVEVLTGW
jgi:hypothetical protein